MSTLDPSALRQHLEQLTPLSDDPGYLVFADWLQSFGHPWGELVVLHHRGLATEADALLDTHGAAILGDLPRGLVEIAWHLGFVRRARLATPADAATLLAVTRTLLGLPIAHMVETLVLDPRPTRFDTIRDWDSSTDNIVDPWPDWDELGPLLAGRVPYVGFGGWPSTAASAYVRMPSFDPINRWLRTVRRLELTGSWRDPSPPLELPNLSELEVRFADATNDAVDAIARSKLPALERLAVGLGGASHCILDDVYPPEDYDRDDPDAERYPSHYSAEDLASVEVHGIDQNVGEDSLRGLLDAIPPRVTDLSLASSALTDELLRTIVAHPCVSRLRRLDLSSCALDDRLAPILIEAAGALSKIDVLDLSRNQLTPKRTTQLATALPNATHDDQGQSEPDFFMRYVATME